MKPNHTSYLTKKLINTSLLFLFFTFNMNAQKYKLVWSDEFNGTGLPDSSKWGYEVGYIRNNELQYYTKNTNNVKQNNGNLEITVIKEPIENKQYSSASIITLNKASWTYGKIEGRFKMPKGQGLWPAFWMLGTNITKGTGWPKCGEIDIFEHINNESVIHATTHWAGADGKHVQDGTKYAVDVTQWHTYSIVWDANYIKWFVDNVPFKEFKIKDNYNSTDEFHLPQYLMINFAIGGDWPGSPDETTVLPATMYCDYIRVYKTKKQ